MRHSCGRKHVAGTLTKLGYIQTAGEPNVFFHPEGTEIALHVDDFLAIGDEDALDELGKKLAEFYEIKTKITGPDENDHKEGALGEDNQVEGLGSGSRGCRETRT